MIQPEGDIPRLVELYDHPHAGTAVAVRCFVLPILVATTGVALADHGVLLIATAIMAGVAGWLATYSP